MCCGYATQPGLATGPSSNHPTMLSTCVWSPWRRDPLSSWNWPIQLQGLVFATQCPAGGHLTPGSVTSSFFIFTSGLQSLNYIYIIYIEFEHDSQILTFDFNLKKSDFSILKTKITFEIQVCIFFFLSFGHNLLL